MVYHRKLHVLCATKITTEKWKKEKNTRTHTHEQRASKQTNRNWFMHGMAWHIYRGIYSVVGSLHHRSKTETDNRRSLNIHIHGDSCIYISNIWTIYTHFIIVIFEWIAHIKLKALIWVQQQWYTLFIIHKQRKKKHIIFHYYHHIMYMNMIYIQIQTVVWPSPSSYSSSFLHLLIQLYSAVCHCTIFSLSLLSLPFSGRNSSKNFVSHWIFAIY